MLEKIVIERVRLSQVLLKMNYFQRDYIKNIYWSIYWIEFNDKPNNFSNINHF